MTKNSQNSIERKTKAGGTDISWLRLNDEATLIKSVLGWRKNKQRSVGQNESPETDPCECSQLGFGKRAKATQWRRSLLFRVFRSLPDVRTRYAADVSTVCCDQVQSYWCFLVRGRVCSTFKEKFLKGWEIWSQTGNPAGHVPPKHVHSQESLQEKTIIRL